jgi:hypothetical protein
LCANSAFIWRESPRAGAAGGESGVNQADAFPPAQVLLVGGNDAGEGGGAALGAAAGGLTALRDLDLGCAGPAHGAFTAREGRD